MSKATITVRHRGRDYEARLSRHERISVPLWVFEVPGDDGRPAVRFATRGGPLSDDDCRVIRDRRQAAKDAGEAREPAGEWQDPRPTRVEHADQAGQFRRVTSPPVEQLWFSGDLTDNQRQAGKNLRTAWEIMHGATGGKPGPGPRIYEPAEARLEATRMHQAALQAAGKIASPIVVGLVLEEKSIAEVAAATRRRHGTVIRMLADALDRIGEALMYWSAPS